MRKLASANSQNQLQLVSDCPLISTVVLLSGRWKLVLLWQLHRGLRRFSEMRRAIPGIAEKMLTTQLRELERDGFIERQVFAEVPLHVEYTLLPPAVALIPILEQIEAWGQAHGAVARVQRHYLGVTE